MLENPKARLLKLVAPLSSNRHHLDDCLVDKWRFSELFSAVLCTTIVHSYKHRHIWAVLTGVLGY